jgi:hypothetical protein
MFRIDRSKKYSLFGIEMLVIIKGNFNVNWVQGWAAALERWTTHLGTIVLNRLGIWMFKKQTLIGYHAYCHRRLR